MSGNGLPSDAARASSFFSIYYSPKFDGANPLRLLAVCRSSCSQPYITADNAFHPNPCDSATPGYVMWPPYVFTPWLIAGFSLQARSRPLAHNSARYGNVALVSPKVDVCGTAAGIFDTQ